MASVLRRGAFGAVIVVCTFASAPAEATAAPSSFVVMLSDREDLIGGGVPHFFHPGNARFRLKGTARDFTVAVSGGRREDSYTMEFAAPRGKKLRKGVFVGAQRAPFRDAGRPGIDISGGHRGCNLISGLFQIKDLAVDVRGAVTRVWLIYEQHCEKGRMALYGEVRVGEPPQKDPALAAPLTVRWPESDVGTASTVVPVMLLARRSVLRVTGVSVMGAHPGDFPIRSDECTGRTLAAGASCRVWLQFSPAAPGARLAKLRIAGADGRHRSVALQGIAFGGRTSLVMTSDPGDYIGGGRPWSYTFANSRLIEGVGTRGLIGLGLVGDDGISWSAAFAPPRGAGLAAGTYLDATRWPFNDNGPGMDISRTSRGCNTLTGWFKINSIAWWPDRSLRSASVTFEQHCEGGGAALRGTFEYRAADPTKLPWWRVATSSIRSPKCVVPRVLGKRLPAAKKAIRRAHCRVGRITRPSSSNERGRVVGQRPRPGRRLKRGARVDLAVSRGRR